MGGVEKRRKGESGRKKERIKEGGLREREKQGEREKGSM